jgi:predicted glycoside hydrolase/deacetylase ChbG (UPF0249 family)
MEVLLIFLPSNPKLIDENLKKAVIEIEEQSAGLSVLAARQFRYSLCQNTVELTMK